MNARKPDLTATAPGTHRYVIHGASDDLIELCGPLEEEFNTYEDTGHLALSNGALLRWLRDPDGYWHFRLLTSVADLDIAILSARGEDAEPRYDVDGCAGYSEKVVIVTDEPLVWAAFIDNDTFLASNR